MSAPSASSAAPSTHVLSEQCCDPGSTTSYPATLSFPSGQEVKIGGVDCYSVNSASSRVVLFSTDVFGWRYANNRQNADQIAAGGFHVVIPDLFDGGAVAEADLADPARGPAWLLKEWFPKYPQQQTANAVEAVAKAIKDEGKATSIQAIAYCYGTVALLRLYSSGLASSGMVAHPTGFTKDNVSECIAPTLFNCAGTDHRFPPELRQHWQQALEQNNVPAKFVDYPGTQHGFAVRDDGSPAGVAARQRALEETITWLKQHAAA